MTNELLRPMDAGGAAFYCPGCKEMHHISSDWQINFESNTVSPSIAVSSGHYAPQFKDGDACWCTYNAEHPKRKASFNCAKCHSWITDGLIRYEADTTHELSGQTVPLEAMK